MVLILSFLLHFFGPDGSLLLQYKSDADKAIVENLNNKDYNLKNLDFESGELYKIEGTQHTLGYLLLAEVAACNLGGCHRFEKVRDDKSSEYFDLLVITDSDMNVMKVEIMDYYSDFGYEVTSGRYLKKFKNKSACQFSQDTDEIDAISGATISSYALEAMIAKLCDL